MSLLSFLVEYKWVILFYLIIILIIIIKRKKFQFQAKFIALYRTKIGLKLIKKIGTRYSEFIKILGYIGIGIGYTGMAVILFFIIKGLYDLVFVPEAPAIIAPVLPGVAIPGSPVFVPFWYGIISLFIVVLIHEFSHGIVARAHDLPVRNTGIVFFGPLIGAFVEPDEKKIKKQKDVVQYSIFAAGPFSNILTAGIVILLFILLINPLSNAYIQPRGVVFTEVEPSMPAAEAGLEQGVVYTYVNNYSVKSTEDFVAAFEGIEVNQSVLIRSARNNHTVTTTARPDAPESPVIGVSIKTSYTNEDNVFAKIFLWFTGLFSWIFMLSLGLGLANLLPLGPVDGGRMLGVSLSKTLGEKKGKLVWGKITIIMIIIIVILLVTPILKAIIG